MGNKAKTYKPLAATVEEIQAAKAERKAQCTNAASVANRWNHHWFDTPAEQRSTEYPVLTFTSPYGGCGRFPAVESDRLLCLTDKHYKWCKLHRKVIFNGPCVKCEASVVEPAKREAKAARKQAVIEAKRVLDDAWKEGAWKKRKLPDSVKSHVHC